MKKYELFMYMAVAALFTLFFMFNGARAIADERIFIGVLMVLAAMVSVCFAVSFGEDIKAKKWDGKHQKAKGLEL